MKSHHFHLLIISILLSTVMYQPVTAAVSEDSVVISHGPYGGTVLQLAADPANDQGIFVAIKGVGLFHSADSAAQWSFIFSGIGDQGNFAIDAVDPDLIYVTRQGEGLYRSQDGGESWSALSLSTAFDQVYSVRAFTHPDQSGVVYAALSYGSRDDECSDHCGLYRSSDSGESWNWIGVSFPVDVKIDAVAFQVENPSILYAGTSEGSLYRSADGGNTWDYQDAPLNHISRMVSAQGGNLYLIGSGEGFNAPLVHCIDTAGVLDCRDVSGDPDYVWIDKSSGATISDGANTVTDLCINPENSLDMIVSTGYRVARSEDGGNKWIYYEDTSSPAQSTAVMFDPVSPQSDIFAGNNQGIWYTTQADATDGTGGWQEGNEGLTGVVPTYVASAPSDSDVVYVNASTGMYLTTDGAETWQRLPIFCEDGFCYTLNTPFTIDPFDAKKIILAAWNYTIHISQDSGQSWSVISDIPKPTSLPSLDDPDRDYEISFHALMAVPGTPFVYLGAAAFHDPTVGDYNKYAGGGLYRSNDGGQTWSLLYTTGDQSIDRLVYDPTNPERVYAGACELASDGTCQQASFLVSNDRGLTWTALTPEDPVLQGLQNTAFLAVRSTDGRLYLASGSAIAYLDDDSAGWAVLGAIPGGSPINQILFDPSPLKSSSYLYAATSDGLYFSQSGGEDFTRYDGKIGYADVTALAAAQRSNGDGFLFIGTAGGQFSSDGLTFRSAVDEAELFSAGIYRMACEDNSIRLPMILR